MLLFFSFANGDAQRLGIGETFAHHIPLAMSELACFMIVYVLLHDLYTHKLSREPISRS